MFEFLQEKPFKCFVGEYDDQKIISRSYQGVKPIPVNKIVGTVGRCHDNEKWSDHKNTNRFRNIKKAIKNMEKMPAIKVYKVEDEYYILDGHHRVLASRDIDRSYIDAEVIEYKFDEQDQDNNQEKYKNCPMKEFNEKTGLQGFILRSKESYQSLFEIIKNYAAELSKNISLTDAARKWYNDELLTNITEQDNNKNDEQELTTIERYLEEREKEKEG